MSGPRSRSIQNNVSEQSLKLVSTSPVGGYYERKFSGLWNYWLDIFTFIIDGRVHQPTVDIFYFNFVTQKHHVF